LKKKNGKRVGGLTNEQLRSRFKKEDGEDPDEEGGPGPAPTGYEYQSVKVPLKNYTNEIVQGGVRDDTIYKTINETVISQDYIFRMACDLIRLYYTRHRFQNGDLAFYADPAFDADPDILMDDVPAAIPVPAFDVNPDILMNDVPAAIPDPAFDYPADDKYITYTTECVFAAIQVVTRSRILTKGARGEFYRALRPVYLRFIYPHIDRTNIPTKSGISTSLEYMAKDIDKNLKNNISQRFPLYLKKLVEAIIEKKKLLAVINASNGKDPLQCIFHNH
jgi:hypothetical protein